MFANDKTTTKARKKRIGNILQNYVLKGKIFEVYSIDFEYANSPFTVRLHFFMKVSWPYSISSIYTIIIY